MPMVDELMRVEEELESNKIRIFAKVKEVFRSEKRKIVAKFEEELESNKMRICAEVDEEIESTKRSICAKLKSYAKDGNQTLSRSNLKLELRNGIAREIYTGEKIKGEGGVPIQVALVDDGADVVDDEPEASAEVEFFLLKGQSEGDDWTAEGFEASMVPQVKGKPPILAGDVAVQLKGGVAVAENIKIRHHASMIRPSEFRLGARVVGASVRVKEAKTEAFALKNYRANYFKKHENPSLSDKVSRLIYIWKGGKIDRRLRDNKIYTVEDFLIQLLINPKRLKSIVNSPAKNWEAIVHNAQACLSSEKVYCYIDQKQRTGVVFDILGRMLGLCSGSHYSRTSTLSEKHKAGAEKLLAYAYQNWGQVKAFDDQNSLQQHLAGLTPHIEKSGACEVVGESSCRRSNISFHSANSTMNLFGDKTDFGCFTDDIDGLYDTVMQCNHAGLYDAVMQCNHAWPCSPSRFMSEPNADEAPIVVSSGDSPRRWRKLLCVAKWFSVRRRVALDVSPDRKKQRVV